MKALWQQIPNTLISELLCQNSKIDAIVLDLEHGAFNLETAYSCIQVITLSGKKALVRLSKIDEVNIKYFLDSGVDGIIFSTVDSMDKVKEIVRLCHYPNANPEADFAVCGVGCRRGYGLVRQNMYGHSLEPKEITLIAQIENKESVDMLGNYLDNANPLYKFIDYFMIGPYDLSASLGCVGDFKNEKFVKYMEKFSYYIPAKKRGMHLVKLEHINNGGGTALDYGFIAYGLDTLMVLDMVKEIEQKV